MKKLLTLGFCIVTFGIMAQNSHPITAEKTHQFDFWIGEWDVNLLIQQKDKSWESKIQSLATIYPILKGKAIMELWDNAEDGILGYSLRYYNPQKDKWDLWLNWPGKDRSGTSGMEGYFTHGRGEFFSERHVNDSTTRIERYTFSDITPTSLRWDDGYSIDGGKSWSSNWIMEFTRKRALPPVLNVDTRANTYYEGKRCNSEAFNPIKGMTGLYTADEGTLKLVNALDGCQLLGFINEDVFFTLTYNTYSSSYELTFLDARAKTSLGMYYGQLSGDTLRLMSGEKNDGKSEATLKHDGQRLLLDIQYFDKDYSFEFKKG